MKVYILSILILLSVPLFSQESSSVTYQEIKTNLQPRLNTLSAKKNNSVLKQADEEVQRLSTQNLDAKAQALLSMYEGAFTTIKARDSWNLPMKSTYLNEGLEIMEGVYPDDFKDDPQLYLTLLLIRGLSNSNVPSAFSRKPFALRDLNQAINDANFGEVDAPSQKLAREAVTRLNK